MSENMTINVSDYYIGSYSMEDGENFFRDLIGSKILGRFSITYNPVIYRHYRILNKFHRVIHRNEIQAHIEWFPCGFKIEFGHRKNLMGGAACGFWPAFHDNSVDLTYLEKMALRLLRRKIIDAIEAMGYLTSHKTGKENCIDFILEKEIQNTHIHGGAKSLEEIHDYVLKHLPNYHRLNATGDLIYGGDVVWFYSGHFGNRLVYGTCIHNINNMWWVISGGILHNVASHDLWFSSNGLPQRKTKPLDAIISRMKDRMKSLALKEMFPEAMRVKELIERLNQKRILEEAS